MSALTLEELTGSRSLSYSSLDSYLQCGERYLLEKIVKVPQAGAWYLIGGSAVHAATEAIDKAFMHDGEIISPVDAWAQAWANETSKADTLEGLRAGGRATKEWPGKENGDWWQAHGPGMVADWVGYRDELIEQGYSLVDVELGFEIEVDGTWVRGYIDRVFRAPDKGLRVVDLKAGQHTPASSLQLGVYRLGIMQTLGEDATLGGYYMCRKGTVPEWNWLGRYSPELVGRWLSNTKRAIEIGLFTPHVTSMCTSCSVAQYCEATGGNRPATYDSVLSAFNATSH